MLGIARDTGASLKATGGRGGTGTHSRARGVLIAAEVALAVVILAGAGLMIKSMARLLAIDPGLDPERVAVTAMALPQKDLYGPPERTTFCVDLDQALRRIPGVAAVGAISHLPLSGASAGRALSFEGRTPPERGFSASYRLTCPGYFEALGIRMIRGRDFTHADATTAPGVAIINEELAAQYWPGEEPLGRRVKIGSADSTNRWLTIVGIARTVRHTGLDVAPSREIFLPYSQSAWPVMTVVVKSTVAQAPLAEMRRALRNLDPDRPVAPWRTMDDVIVESTGPRRFPMLLLAAFAAVALALAVIGVFGVVSYLVNQRTREIGIRMALGARASQLVGAVVRRSLVPVAWGMVLGVAGAMASSRFLESFLFEVTPYDPAVLGAVALLLATSAFVASLVPARRAAAVDPIVVLKEE
jgi:putative ABC transport system permease protein